MSGRVIRLYPEPNREKRLAGLYLQHRLHELGSPAAPFVYANFVSSLDGRIALKDSPGGDSYLPERITSTNDFRLFLELHAQADCLITHGGYLRALADGRLDNILQVGGHGEEDLLPWRREHGLRDQPTVVIASASLEFPLHDSLKESGQQVYIATGQIADAARVRHWERQGFEVLRAGSGRMVEGAPLVAVLGERGFQSLYLIAGPQMLETMLRDKRLRRLYLTTTHQLVGGENFRSLLPGPELGEAGDLTLLSLYYDPWSPQRAGQLFGQYEVTGNQRDAG